MKLERSLLKWVAIVLLVIAAILFFANKETDVGMGLAALGLAAWAGA
jgi:Na+/phosphate symporter